LDLVLTLALARVPPVLREKQSTEVHYQRKIYWSPPNFEGKGLVFEGLTDYKAL